MHLTTTTFWAKLLCFCVFVLLPFVGLAQATEICNNGKDDDGDNLVDCQDPDCPECARFINCIEPNTCYMPPIYGNPTDANSQIYGTQDLVLSTSADFTTVTIRTLDGSYTKTVVVTATGSTVVSIPTSVIMSNSPNTIQQNKGLIITSSEPVQATYRLTAFYNQDIVPLKCKAALGYAFYAGSQTRLSGNNGIDERHFVGVMATQPNTVVTFRSPIALEGVSAALGQPFSVTLNAGETYLLTTKVINSSSTENKSMSGVLVTSNQPIVVNSGSQHNYQPYSGNRDAGIDQLVPARITGQNYIAVHGQNTANNSDYVIVVAVENNTSVSINGPASVGAASSNLANTSLNAGGVYTFNLPNTPNRAFAITSSKRVYVYHVSSYAANEFGMGILPTINPCNGSKQIDFYRTSGSSNDQAIVIIPTTGLSTLTFRGNPYTTYGTVVDRILVSGVEQSVVSFPDGNIATAANVNTITSAERFHVEVVSNTGGGNTGNYGFYSNYEAKVDVLNPDTNQPDDFYTAAKVDVNVANMHCLKMTSCGNTNTITKIISGSLTQSATFDAATNCITYTMKPSAPICARDTIRVGVVNELGKEGVVCLEYVNKRSDLIVSVIQSSTFVCQPTTTPVSFTVLAQSGGAKYGYQWITPDKQILSASVVTGALPGRYIITVGDGNQCTDTRSLTVAGDSPSAVFTGLGGTTVSACGGTTVTYSVSATLGTLAWSVTNGTIVGPASGTSVAVRWNVVTSSSTGTLRVNLTSPNGCQTAITQNVTIFQLPTLSAVGTNPGCSGASNGRIDLTVAGGAAPYTYRWSNGTSVEDPSGLVAGVYSVTVTDKNNCAAAQPLSITLTNPTTFTVATAQTNLRCFGATTGSASILVSGGSPGYGYTWSNGRTTASVTGLAAGSYTVTVSDVNNCTTSRVFSVTQPPALVVQPISQNPACNGAATGSVSVSVSGGVGGYGYRWSNAASTSSINGLTTGTYSVTVTDANSCTTSATATLTQPTALSLTATTTNLICFGQPTGRIDLTVSGGTVFVTGAAYQYNWTNGATNEDPTGLSAGTYSVTVTDGGNCPGTLTVNITQPNPLTANAQAGTVSCANGLDGTISLAVGGGTAPYRYQWSDTQTGNTNQNRTGLSAGAYSVTITDANNCQTTATATLTNPVGLTALSTVTNVGCSGATSGAISITAAGGTGVYSYSWNTGSMARNLTNLPASQYAVTITDTRGCVFNLGAAVLQPRPLSTTVLSTSANCPGGTGNITVQVQGGTEAYSYKWSNGATSATVYLLPANQTYSLTVTDANNCTATTSATINQPPDFALNAVVKPVPCNGAATGEIDLTVQGGTTPYTYRWSNGSTAEDQTGLVAGVYSVTVTDKNNCKEITSINVQEPALVTLTESHTNVACFGQQTGAIDLTTNGGTKPFAFDWKNNAGKSIGSTEDITALSADIYRVIVTDKNGCITPLSVTVSQPPAISLTLSTTAVACNGNNTGQINVAVSGGTGAFTYRWNTNAITQNLTNLTAGTYSVTATDANGCTSNIRTTISEPLALTISATTENIACAGGATGRISITASGGTPGYKYLWYDVGGKTANGPANRQSLLAGTYSVTVTDANGCQKSLIITLTEPPALSLTPTQKDISCFGGANGTISIAVSGGTPGAGYGFSWADNVSTQNRQNLPAGTYSLTVSDANRCTTSTTVSLTQPATLSVSAVATAVRCNNGTDGTISLRVLGGTAPYQFSWRDSEAPSPITTQNRTGLGAGSYAVIVTDQNQCSRGVSLSVSQPERLFISLLPAPVSCFGGANGSVRAEISGGTAGVPGQPYRYQWSDASANNTNRDRTGLSAGTYSLTVTDANNCQQVASTTITQPTALLLSAQTVPVTCNSGNTGAIDLTVSGGELPYRYAWNTNAATEDLSSLVAGTYSVTVTDKNNCAASLTVVISQPTDLSVNTILSNIRCFGDHTGSIRLFVTGGTGSMEQMRFSWIDQYGLRPDVRADLQDLAAGSYTVVVTDLNNCTALQASTLTQPPLIVITSEITDVSCFGGSDGAISVTVTGGVPAASGPLYQYFWTRGYAQFQSNDKDLSGKEADVYSLIVTDENGCQGPKVLTINQPDALTLSVSGTTPTCFSGNTGTASLTVSGGTKPYRYSWSNGATTQSLTGLSAGNYTVTVTDAKQCQISQSVSLTQPNGLVLNTATTPALCFSGATGTASVSVSGGTGVYGYAWAGPMGALNTKTANLTGIMAGSYSVVVTDANGCSATQQLMVSQPTVFSVTTQVTDLLCFGRTNGAIRLGLSGGTGTIDQYRFAWIDKNGLRPADNLSGLMDVSAGSYTVVVTDANGCSATSAATVRQPTALTVSALPTDAPCFGSTGQATIEVRGGTADYTYEWRNANGQPVATSPTVYSLVAGTYSLTVTDANGCAASTQAVVNQPPNFALNGVVIAVACSGGNTGSVNLTVEGATPPYRYLWSNGASTQDVSGLAAGPISVTVTDANNCTESTRFNLSEPGSLSVSLSSTPVLCFGGATGTASLTASSGTQPYRYQWSTGAVTASISSLSAGSYSVVVTDNNSCTITQNVSISQPTALSLNSSNTSILCFGGATGTASVTASGGIQPYQYQWNTLSDVLSATTANVSSLSAGSYSVVVTDKNGCVIGQSLTIGQPTALSLNLASSPVLCFGGATGTASVTASGGTLGYGYLWNTGATTASVTSLSVGSYSVVITDRNSCSITGSIIISQPTALSLNLASSPVLCFGGATGTASVTASGGISGYTYLWNTGATTANVSSLSAGSYSVVVTDKNGCVIGQSLTIGQPTALSLNTSNTSVLCFGGATGTASVTASGGTSGYTYLWNTSAVTTSISSLSAGSYTVVVTDVNGCSATSAANVRQPTGLVVSALPTDAPCFGSTGQATIEVRGGTADYTYEWRNANGQPVATSQTVYSLVAGTYSLTVTDANGCAASTQAVVNQPPNFALNGVVIAVACKGGNTGSVNLTVEGATPPYRYLWSNGASTQDVSGLAAGPISVTVTDANNCTESTRFNLSEPGSLSVSLSSTPVLCFGGATGTASLTASSGTQPYRYQWSTGAVTANISSLSAGSYSVVVTDKNDCSFSQNLTISQPTALSLNISNTAVLCFGGATGTASVTASGGTSDYTYLWNTGATTASISSLSVGNYVVIVSDANGCSANASTSIGQPTALTANGVIVPVACFGQTGSVNLSVGGGTPNYSYFWENGATTQDVSGLSSGSYSVTVVDGNGCRVDQSFNLSQPGGLSVATSSKAVLCFGGTTGSTSVSASGGTTPYQYRWETGAITASISGLSAGSYSVVVTDRNGCTFTDYVSVNEPSSLTYTLGQVNASCNGSATGSLSITALGGTGPYSYSWNTGATTQTIRNLRADEYVVTITDGNGCVLDVGATVEQPRPLSTTVLSTSANCPGGTGFITVEVVGGVPDYAYRWSNGSTGSTVYQLPMGSYSLVVTDANGCTATTQAVVSQPPTFALNAVAKPVLCKGAASGEVNLTVEGGTSPYRYQWSIGQTSQDIVGLLAGTYSVTVTDKNGCREITSDAFGVAQESGLFRPANGVSFAECRRRHGSLFVFMD
jgi:SprB repeat